MARNKDLHRIFCENVRARRHALELTQQEVADRLGVSQATYNSIEAGKRVPGLTVIQRVAKALRIEPADLLQARTLIAAG